MRSINTLMKTCDLISIILPVHNQADHIAEVVSRFDLALSHILCRYELILVSNACRDDSADICRGLARSCEHVRAIESREGGWGRAVRVGLRESTGNLLAYTNTARTTPALLAMLVLHAVVNPNCVVKTTRLGRSGLRLLGSTAYNFECKLLFQVPSWDVNGTPKIFPRSFEKLLTLSRNDDLIDLEFMKICRHEAYPVVEIPVYSESRHGGDSTTRLNSAFNLYYGAYRMWREKNK